MTADGILVKRAFRTGAEDGMRSDTLTLECDEYGRVALQFADGATHRDVLVRRAAPLSDPEHYIVFLDADGQELCVVRDPRSLSPNDQAIVTFALERHYLRCQVTAVLSLRIEAEVCYFDAETSRGR